MTTVGDMLYQMGGVPVGGEFTTGSVFFVDSNTGSNSNDGKSPDTAFATLDYAIGQCTASKGDIIYLMPGHAETTTAIAVDVAGVSIKGLGRGSARPTITATTGASDLIDITAAGTYMENVLLVGAASGCTALIDIASADNTFFKVEFRHGAAPTDAVTVTTGVRNKWHDCTWNGTADGPDNGIEFQGAAENIAKDFEVIGCKFNYGLYGLDEAAIGAPATACGSVEGGIIKDNVFSGMVLTAVDFNSSSAAAVRGIITGCAGTAYLGLAIATIYDLGSYGSVKNDAVDDFTKGSGLLYGQFPAGTCS